MDEHRTDEDARWHFITCRWVMFGLGVFEANVAFQTFSGSNYRGWRAQGYFSQMQWGYALALFASVRGEKSSAWIDYLTPNVKSDFRQGRDFIDANPGLVFRQINDNIA